MATPEPLNVGTATVATETPGEGLRVSTVAGASIAHDYGRRRMKAIPVFAHELRTLGLLNTLATGFFSFASFCFAILLNIVISGVLAENLTHTAKLSLWFGGIAAGIMAASLILAGVMLRLRGSGVTAIEGETTYET